MNKKYVKDYVPDSSGKNQYHYIGDYFLHDLDPVEQKKKGTIQVLLGLLEILVILAAGCINCHGTKTVYVVIPFEFMILCAVFYIMGSWNFRTCGQRMERAQYETSFQRMVEMVAIGFFLNLFALLGDVVLILMNRNTWTDYSELILFVILVALLICNFFAFRYHRELMKHITEEKAKKPEEQIEE